MSYFFVTSPKENSFSFRNFVDVCRQKFYNEYNIREVYAVVLRKEYTPTSRSLPT